MMMDDSKPSSDSEEERLRVVRNAAFYRGRDAERFRRTNKEEALFDALVKRLQMWRDRACGAEGQLSAIRNEQRLAIPAETSAYIARLERMALNDDGYRCDACELVFDVEDIVFGEDCHLCKNCAAHAREEVNHAG